MGVGEHKCLGELPERAGQRLPDPNEARGKSVGGKQLLFLTKL